MINDLATLKCRFDCADAPVVLVEFEEGGCICWPDRLQALCRQHLQVAEPIKGCRVVYELYPTVAPHQEKP